MDDDMVFVGYLPSARDPGYAILIATMLFCISSNLMLPCLVSLGRRYEKKRLACLVEQDAAEEENLAVQPASTKEVSRQLTMEARYPAQDDMVSSVVSNSYIHGKGTSRAVPSIPRSSLGVVQNVLDKLIMPPYPDDVDCSTLNKGAFSAFSNASDATGSTDSRYGSTSFLDAGFGTRARTRGLRGHRRLLMDAQKRRQDQQVEESADAKRFKSRMFGSTGVDGREATALTSHHHVDHSSEVSSHANSRLGSKSRHTHKHGTSSAVSGSESALGAPPSSVLSRLEDHMITPGDAADADDPGHYILPKPGMEGDDELDLCCGENAWWKPSTIAMGFDRIVVLAEWDHELKRIVTLSIPFILTALILGINQTITVTLVSQFIGTDAVVAFVLVELVLGLTYAFFCGFVSTEATLCSQAVGARNFKLAGQYVQICAAIFTICMIPNIVIWSFVIEDVIHLFGFGAKVANIGHMYAVVLLFRHWINGVNYAYHGLLNVIDREKWCTFISVAEDSVGVLAILGVVLTKETTLQEIGLIKLGVSVVFFVFNSWYTVYRGWVNDYLEGMLGSCALHNRKAVYAVIKTGIPLSLGYFIEYGEWEVLTIFAAALGPAEVAAWGLIGTIWSTFESLTNGIGNGGEVRCAYHLGAGNPAMARVSAYKSILLGVVASCFFTSILFIVGEDMAVWLTPDPTLQHMIAELLPLLGIGNVALTAGTVAWALVGSQGRYRLATLIAFIFSWGVTMPMSATFTFVAKFNLQGITAAVVMGYSVTGTALIYILLRSDWERLSQCAMNLNDFEDEELEHLRPEDEIKAKESTVAASRVELDVDASC